MKTGILLYNLGGPERLPDVRPFLYNLFSDPEIIRIKWSPLRKLVAYSIATLRHKKSEGYYAQIGGGSPLRKLTEEQGAALQREMRSRGHDIDAFVGMCTWHPFFKDVLPKIEQARVEKLVVLPLFPQYSVTTTGSGSALLRRLIEQRPGMKGVEVKWLCSWQDQPTYIEAFSTSIERELAGFASPGDVQLLFSAHSIPESYVRKGDPYLDHTKQSVELIMERLGRKNPYQLSFQSKIGPVKWLDPFTNDVIADYGKKGIHNVLVIPISFVSEHIETLYELDILYRDVAAAAGVKNFRRVPALNSDAVFIKALADLVEGQLQE